MPYLSELNECAVRLRKGVTKYESSVRDLYKHLCHEARQEAIILCVIQDIFLQCPHIFVSQCLLFLSQCFLFLFYGASKLSSQLQINTWQC